jgi:hypothetical protein
MQAILRRGRRIVNEGWGWLLGMFGIECNCHHLNESGSLLLSGHWVFVEELGKDLRVVTLEDDETVHNAFPDRNFEEEIENEISLLS